MPLSCSNWEGCHYREGIGGKKRIWNLKRGKVFWKLHPGRTILCWKKKIAKKKGGGKKNAASGKGDINCEERRFPKFLREGGEVLGPSGCERKGKRPCMPRGKRGGLF